MSSRQRSRSIPSGFFLLSRDVDGRQRAGAIEHGELTRIAAVGFHTVAGPAGNERRRNDVTRNVVSRQGPVQREPTRAGFVAALDRPVSLEKLEEAENRWDIGRQAVQGRRPVGWK
jgi:hypothetical protein